MSLRDPAMTAAAYPLAQLASAFALGIVLASRLQSVFLPCAVAVVLASAAVAFLLKRKLQAATLAVLLTTALLGSAFAVAAKTSTQPHRLKLLLEEGTIKIGAPVELFGVLEREPELAPERLFLHLRVRQIRHANSNRPAAGDVLLLVRMTEKNAKDEIDALDLHYGARLRVTTTLERSDNFRNPGVSSFTEYLDRAGYDATALVKSPLLIERLENERVFLPLAWLYEWRGRLQSEIQRRFSNEAAGVLDAALLGNRYFLSQSTSERFRAGGTFHVLVISGLHITFLGGAVFLIARRFTKKVAIQFLISTTVLWSYALAVGAEPSVVRAAIMFTLIVLAPLLSRHASSLNTLGGAALVLLAWRPDDLFDPSFQLTFVSVAAIVLMAWPLLEKLKAIGEWRLSRETPYPPACSPQLRWFCESLFWSAKRWRAELAQSNFHYKIFKTPTAEKLERYHLQRPLRYAFSTIIVSASVQLMLLPLLVLYFHRLSFASLLLNIWVSLTMAVMAIVALSALLLAQISTAMAGPLIAFTNGLNWLMVHSVDPFARLGLASTRLPEYSGWLVSFYFLYYLPLASLIVYLWGWRPLALLRRGPRKRSMVTLAVLFQFLGISLVVFHPFSAALPDGKLHLDFLDVGQGDAALITMPDGTTLLVDGGGRPGPFKKSDDEEEFERDTRSIGEAVVSEFLWQRGLDRVDYLLATHADADHIDGLNDIAKNFDVRGAFAARTPANDPEWVRFDNVLSEQRIPLQAIGASDHIRAGKVAIDVLWPPPNSDDESPSQNNDSVVLRVTLGQHSFLLTGDIEEPAEHALCRSRENLVADVTKVPHHGSKTSSTVDFVNAVRTRYAVISVGQTSIFGHPNPEVVKRWQDAGAQVLRTGESGTITFTTDGNNMQVETFVKGKLD